jgi:hypothetical protein
VKTGKKKKKKKKNNKKLAKTAIIEIQKVDDTKKQY